MSIKLTLIFALTAITLAVLSFSGCKVQSHESDLWKVVVAVDEKTEVEMVIPPSWEKNHPERASWTRDAYELVDQDFGTLDLAADMHRFCPRYGNLPEGQRKNVWIELLSATSKFESGWNPKSQSVDVGKPNQKDTWSIGLMQISVVDQSWAGNEVRYSYDQLLTPKPNLDLTLAIMKRQIKNTGLVILPNTSKWRYWAVLLSNNKYSKIPEITAMVKKLPFCH